LLAGGFTTAAIVDLVAPLAATVRTRITDDCVAVHRRRHFPRQMPAADVWRRVLEATAAEQASFDKGMNSLLTAAGYFTTVMLKANMTLTAEGTEVSVGDGIAASRELSKLLSLGDDQMRWAEAQAKMNRIIACFREFVPVDRQQEMLARLEGRQLGVIEGGLATTEYVDPFDDDSEDYDEDDD
jgi:hypothetical protein